MSLLERQVSPSSLVRLKILVGILYCRHTANLSFNAKDPFRTPFESLEVFLLVVFDLRDVRNYHL